MLTLGPSHHAPILLTYGSAISQPRHAEVRLGFGQEAPPWRLFRP